MKRNNRFAAVMCALALALVTLLSGCFVPGILPEDTGFNPEDVALVYNGQTVRVKDNALAILNELGDDYTYSESISCKYSANGMDKFFDFADVSITTAPMIPDADHITSVEVWGGSDWKTTRGIGIGSTLADIEAAYGKYYIVDGSMYIYYEDLEEATSSQLYFIIEEGVVTIFGIA